MAGTVKSKMIKITSRGIVRSTSRGSMRTPTRSPYRESVDKIWGLLTQDRATVVEILKNGAQIELNVQNFDQDNNVVEAENKAQPYVWDGVVNMVSARAFENGEMSPEDAERYQAEVKRISEEASAQEKTPEAPTPIEDTPAAEETAPAEETPAEEEPAAEEEATITEEPVKEEAPQPSQFHQNNYQGGKKNKNKNKGNQPVDKKADSASLAVDMEQP